MSKVRL